MITGIGGASWDELLYVDTLPRWNENLSVHTRESRPGGMVATALVAAARLGIPTSLIGSHGSDPAGQSLRGLLSGEGVELEFFREVPGGSSSSVILVHRKEGHRSILNSRGVQSSPELQITPAMMERISRSRLLHLDGHFYRSVLEILENLPEKNRPLVTMDPSSLMLPLKESSRILSLCDYLIPGVSWARKFTRKENMPEIFGDLLCLPRRGLIITQGEKGLYYATTENTEIRHIPAFPVNAVDTTGAGDAFHGGLLAALYQEYPLSDALVRASAVAAINCREKGAQQGLPDKNTLEQFLSRV